MLALRTSQVKVSYNSCIIYNRIGAGCCSIITKRAFPDASEEIIGNVSPRFFMSVHNQSRGVVLSLRKI